MYLHHTASVYDRMTPPGEVRCNKNPLLKITSDIVIQANLG